MGMLKSIRLVNFQSHRNTFIEFSPRINVFVGGSNVGKTSVLRAISWVLYNRPSGLSMVGNYNRDNKGRIIKPVKVKIRKDEDEVVRVRTDKENYYVVNGEKLKAVGRDVPESVKRILNLNEINFQRQFDSSFLLSWSSGEATRYLNKLMGLDKIDRLYSRMSRDKREVKMKLGEIEKEKSDLKSRLKSLGWVEEIKGKLESCEKLDYRIKAKWEEVVEVESLLSEIERMERALERLRILEELKGDFSELEKLEKKVRDLEVEVEEVGGLLDEAERLELKRKKLNDVVGMRKGIEEISKMEKEAGGLREEVVEVESLLNEWINGKKRIEDLEKRISEDKEALPDICPLCGQTWPSNKRKP